MGDVYQIKDQEEAYFLTFQIVGWADVFSRQAYRDIMLQSFDYSRKNKGLELFAYVIMTNHVYAIMRSKNGVLSGLVRDIKKFTSKRILNEILNNKKESRKERLEMIFCYHAKFNKRAKNMQLWTHENHAVELSTNNLIETRKYSYSKLSYYAFLAFITFNSLLISLSGIKLIRYPFILCAVTFSGSFEGSALACKRNIPKLSNFTV